MPADPRFIAPSVTGIPEKDMVRGLFQHSNCSQLLLNQLGLIGAICAHFEVESPVLRGKRRGPGDVDALLYRAGEFDQAVAIEFERIRVAPSAFRTELVGTELRHGVAQANLLRKAGYSRTYLGIIVQIDGRERSAFNFTGRGLTAELLKLIKAFRGREQLTSGVGLLFAEVVQPIDKEFWLAGGIGAYAPIVAVPQSQPAELTNWIEHLHRFENETAGCD